MKDAYYTNFCNKIIMHVISINYLKYSNIWIINEITWLFITFIQFLITTIFSPDLVRLQITLNYTALWFGRIFCLQLSFYYQNREKKKDKICMKEKLHGRRVWCTGNTWCARLRSPSSQESRFSSLMILITSTLITLREKLRNDLES